MNPLTASADSGQRQDTWPVVHVLASQATRAGGADVYTSELLSRLVQQRLSVTLFCFGASPEVESLCPIHVIDRGSWAERTVVWRFSSLLQAHTVCSGLRRLPVGRPDVVLGMAHQLIWAHRRVHGAVPLVYLPHSMIAPEEIKSYQYRSYLQRELAVRFWYREERRSLRRATTTVRFTNAACTRLREYYNLSSSATMAVLPVPSIDYGSADVPKPDGPVRLLSVGRLVPSKNLALLVDVLANCRDLDWTLDILGDGPSRSELERRIASTGLGDRIHLQGHVDPAPFYVRAHCLLMPSLLENAPLVIVEAMSARVPAIAFGSEGPIAVNANSEIIANGVDGFLAKDEREFGSLVRAAIEAPVMLLAAGANARKKAVTKHSWEQHVADLVVILKAASRQRLGHQSL